MLAHTLSCLNVLERAVLLQRLAVADVIQQQTRALGKHRSPRSRNAAWLSAAIWIAADIAAGLSSLGRLPPR